MSSFADWLFSSLHVVGNLVVVSTFLTLWIYMKPGQHRQFYILCPPAQIPVYPCVDACRYGIARLMLFGEKVSTTMIYCLKHIVGYIISVIKP